MTRFALQWLAPGKPGRLTHVMLLDKQRPAPFVFAAGHGADAAHALLNLRATLIQNDESAAAIKYVRREYTRRTGRAPATPIGRSQVLPQAKPPMRPARGRRKH